MLPLPGDDDALGLARPKGKAKAKPKSKSKAKERTTPPALADGDPEAAERPTKKSRVDKEAKQRLDALKLQTDVVHMSHKWTNRIKALNIEVTTSLQNSLEFAHLRASLDWLSGFLKFGLFD